tara:strand:- start:92 stop:325 length:234 start_codon:yes stop_codon:yes gene_type:complete
MIGALKYYIIPKDKIAEYTPIMGESFGHNNIYIRMSLDQKKGIMLFLEELAPKDFTAYDQIEMLKITDGPEWLQIEE